MQSHQRRPTQRAGFSRWLMKEPGWKNRWMDNRWSGERCTYCRGFRFMPEELVSPRAQQLRAWANSDAIFGLWLWHRAVKQQLKGCSQTGPALWLGSDDQVRNAPYGSGTGSDIYLIIGIRPIRSIHIQCISCKKMSEAVGTTLCTLAELNIQPLSGMQFNTWAKNTVLSGGSQREAPKLVSVHLQAQIHHVY